MSTIYWDPTGSDPQIISHLTALCNHRGLSVRESNQSSLLKAYMHPPNKAKFTFGFSPNKKVLHSKKDLEMQMDSFSWHAEKLLKRYKATGITRSEIFWC